MKMLAFVAPRARLGPRSHHEVVRLVEILAIESGIRIGRELLAARAANPSADQTALRDHIDEREFFGQPQRIPDDRKRIAK